MQAFFFHSRVGHRAALTAVGLAWLVSLAGCAQGNPFQNRQAQLGSLRDTVSQLETDKDRLEREVADLNSDNRRLEERLVQEQAYSEQLSGRLNDARRVSRGGIDLDQPTEQATASNRGSSLFDDSDRRTVPANNRGRKTPFAQIPGEVRSSRDSYDRPSASPSSSPRRSRPTTPFEDEPDSASSDLFSHQDSTASSEGIRAARQRWLSLARQAEPDSERTR